MYRSNRIVCGSIALSVLFLFAAGVCYPNAHNKIKPIERSVSFTNIIDRLDEAVIVVDSHANIELFSHGASRLLGVQSDEVLHKPFFWMMDENLRDSHAKLFKSKEMNIDGQTMCTDAYVHRWDHSKFKGSVKVKKVSLDDGKESGYFIHVIEAGKEVQMQGSPLKKSLVPPVIPQP